MSTVPTCIYAHFQLWSNQPASGLEMDTQHAQVRCEFHTKLKVGNLKDSNNLADNGVDKITLAL
jgi:hypothetical protein